MNALRLKELSHSDLYRRRQERPDSFGGSLPRDSLSNADRSQETLQCFGTSYGGWDKRERISDSHAVYFPLLLMSHRSRAFTGRRQPAPSPALAS
ncbi:hypothetical protein SKAU_G00258680 [Synaphobranchus kaupii]|uniref:Uncharacterized protein n=1 Tax=Synaphobranchus kaupii TaxID=118154 RepID=A0A9Q1ISB8_SYNKA|nr:hypothetical protein SKAU_G00258680 [Synaphobranchus kaupii]